MFLNNKRTFRWNNMFADNKNSRFDSLYMTFSRHDIVRMSSYCPSYGWANSSYGMLSHSMEQAI